MVRRYEIYLLSGQNKILSLPRKHKIHIFELTRNVLFIIYRQNDDGVFDDLPKISDHFPKISKNSIKLVRRSQECCRIFFQNFRNDIFHYN